MDSIWNCPFHDHSMIIPHGIYDVHGTTNWLWSQPTVIPWIPHGISGWIPWIPGGFHMDYTREAVLYPPWVIPCGIHGMGGGFHGMVDGFHTFPDGFHMD